MEKKATLKDIAELTNVSVSTVSRVVNGGNPNAASPAVQDIIWEAVKKLNYLPNTTAQELKKGEKYKTSKKKFACIFTRLRDIKSDPFFNEIARAIESESLRLGHLMRYSLSVYSEPESKLSSFLSDNHFDGIIIVGKTNERQVRIIKKYANNVVYVSLNKLNLDIDQVICDGYEGAKTALNYLTRDKIEDVYYLGEIGNEARHEAFRDFMILNGQSNLYSKQSIKTKFSLEDSYFALKRVFKKGIIPRKLFCGNDVTALGAMKAIHERGLKIPEDIEVIGIDNIEMAQFSSPMLTTINVPTEQLGIVAVRFLNDKIKNGSLTSPLTISIPSTLVVRETTK